MKINNLIVILTGLSLLQACRDGIAGETDSELPVVFSSGMYSAAIHNINIWTYDGGGSLVAGTYSDDPAAGVYLSAAAGSPCYVYALANFGKMEAPADMEALSRWSVPLSEIDSLRSSGHYPLSSLSSGEMEFGQSGMRHKGAEIAFSAVGTPLYLTVDRSGLKEAAVEITAVTFTQAAADIQPFTGRATAQEGVYVQQAAGQETLRVLQGGAIPFLVAGADRVALSPVLTVKALCRTGSGASVPKSWSYSLMEDSGESLPLPWGKGYTLSLHLRESGNFVIGEWLLRRNSQALL